MQADHRSFQDYQRAAMRLQGLEQEVYDQLEAFLQPPEGRLKLTVRELAFLEGLRHERDEAQAVAREAEAGLINELVSRLGLPPDTGN